jgi:hypothetical protein
MKYLFGVLFLFVSGIVYPATVINYDDGSTYTLEDNQEIYISTPNSSLFKRQLMGNKDTFFRVQKPWTVRDYVPQPQDPFAIGSHNWCKVYIPWSEGLTFDMISWQITTVSTVVVTLSLITQKTLEFVTRPSDRLKRTTVAVAAGSLL